MKTQITNILNILKRQIDSAIKSIKKLREGK